MGRVRLGPFSSSKLGREHLPQNVQELTPDARIIVMTQEVGNRQAAIRSNIARQPSWQIWEVCTTNTYIMQAGKPRTQPPPAASAHGTLIPAPPHCQQPQPTKAPSSRRQGKRISAARIRAGPGRRARWPVSLSDWKGSRHTEKNDVE